MDPWNTNAWPTEEDTEIPNQLAPKWEYSDDNDESTDANLPPSWSISSAAGSVWDIGNDVWTSTGNTASDEPSWNQHSKVDLTTTQAIDPLEGGKSTDVPVETVRPALPTPPSSPSTPSAPLPSKDSELVEDTSLETPGPQETLTTPDPFGSFESAQETLPFNTSTSAGLSWSTHLAFEAGTSLDEPWKSSWDSPTIDDGSISKSQTEDEWEAAQQVQRNFNEKIPQERLQSIISQWEAIAKQHFSSQDLPGGEDYSWRKGLENVPGLLGRVDTLIPPSYFTLPTPFPQSEIAKAVKEALRLTRSYTLSQSSPMAQFYASKGSTEWENLVKMQNLVAKDEWGWDLKQGKEEFSESQDSVKEPERKSGFLSFWKRRTPSESISESVQTEKKEQTQTQSSTLAPSLRSSLENPPMSPLPSKPARESGAGVSPTESRTSDSELQQVQPSVVSRFLNRLSRRPPSGFIVETAEQHSPTTPVSLSVDDLAFLSDIDTKSTSNLSIHKSSGSTTSLMEIAASPSVRKEQFRSSLPPPPTLSRTSSATTKHSDVIDLLSDDRVGSSSVNRSPYSEQINSLLQDIPPFEDKPSAPSQKLPATATLDSLSPVRSNAPISLKNQPHVSPSTSTIPPPPPSSQFGRSKPSLSSSKSDPIAPSSAFNELNDFVSSVSSPLIKNNSSLANLVFENNDNNDDMGDFGDFVSMVPQIPPKTESYVKKADSRASSSVTIPILKPPPKFTTNNHFEFGGRDLGKNLGTESPLHPAGKISPLPPPPSQLVSMPFSSPIIPQQTRTMSSTLKASPSRESTPKPVSTSTINKSGLSAQDLSFFEGL